MERNENDPKVKIIDGVSALIKEVYPELKFTVKLEQGVSNQDGAEKDAIRLTIISEN